MGKTWRRERYESDENSSRNFTKSQKKQWIDQEIIDEYGYEESESEDEEVNNNK